MYSQRIDNGTCRAYYREELHLHTYDSRIPFRYEVMDLRCLHTMIFYSISYYLLFSINIVGQMKKNSLICGDSSKSLQLNRRKNHPFTFGGCFCSKWKLFGRCPKNSKKLFFYCFCYITRALNGTNLKFANLRHFSGDVSKSKWEFVCN